jgi:hypothetical protein
VGKGVRQLRLDPEAWLLAAFRVRDHGDHPSEEVFRMLCLPEVTEIVWGLCLMCASVAQDGTAQNSFFFCRNTLLF